MGLGLSYVACNGAPCAGSDVIPLASVNLVFVDSVTELRICDASISCPSCSGAANASTHPDGSCNYGLGLPPGSTTSVTASAPGFASRTFEIAVPASTCGSSPPGTTSTFSLTPLCSRPTVHHDGLGQQWPDCTAAGTYTSSEATAACAYYQPTWMVSTYCASAMCTTVDGSAVTVICTAQDPLSVTGPNRSGECVCWGYDGSSAGHVRLSGNGCECPGSGDPTWQ